MGSVFLILYFTGIAFVIAWIAKGEHRMGTSQRHGASKNPWRCEFCGEAFVVPSLARECELGHIEEEV